uniref:Nitric oxide synthase-interacting protein zinc-finger domain-containing protein n=1 Tax=Bos indicus x Bos taurus TaxID=30522 RepID=A0A4W2EAS3_BOBOX
LQDHPRWCTAGHTHHREEKDTWASGYGAHNIQLGPDMVWDCDCSCRSQQPSQTSTSR